MQANPPPKMRGY
ncbi:MAG: hypothetical protein EZS28_000445, partial [Streblomastix strix]